MNLKINIKKNHIIFFLLLACNQMDKLYLIFYPNNFF